MHTPYLRRYKQRRTQLYAGVHIQRLVKVLPSTYIYIYIYTERRRKRGTKPIEDWIRCLDERRWRKKSLAKSPSTRGSQREPSRRSECKQIPGSHVLKWLRGFRFSCESQTHRCGRILFRTKAANHVPYSSVSIPTSASSTSNNAKLDSDGYTYGEVGLHRQGDTERGGPVSGGCFVFLVFGIHRIASGEPHERTDCEAAQTQCLREKGRMHAARVNSLRRVRKKREKTRND